MSLKVINWTDQEQVTSGDLLAGETLSLSNLTAGLLLSGGNAVSAFQVLSGMNVLGTNVATVTLKAGTALDGLNLGVIEVTADQTINILSGAENQASGIWGTGQAANATYPRKTVIGIKAALADTDSASRVFWNSSTSASYSQTVNTRKANSFLITVVHGTAAASPAEPALPAGYQKLAVVTVAANATTIADANIAKSRPYTPKYAPGLTIQPVGDLLSTDKVLDVRNLAGTTLLSVKQDGTMPELDARFVLATAKGVANGVATLDAGALIPVAQIPSLSYVPTSQRGAVNGVATLDGTGKVPTAQLPAMNYIPTSDKGAANGVATLDGTGVLTTAQIPGTLATQTYVTTQLGNYVPTSQKGAVNGVASLDGSGKVPSAQLPAMNYIPTSDKGVASGVATLDVNTLIPVAQIPSTIARTTDLSSYVPTSQRGAANGVATLDSGTKIPVAQIPALSYIASSAAGAANGVATLDSNVLIPVAQIPSTIARMTDLSSYVPTSAKGVANGVATLDAGTLIPVTQIPTSIARTSDLSSYVPLTQKGTASGVATLDASTKVPDTQIPSTIARTSDLSSYVTLTQKGAANGVATLDAGALIPVAQIPALSYIAASDKGAASGVATLDATGKLVQDAKTLGGYAANTGAVANTIPVRDGAGKLNADKLGGATPSTGIVSSSIVQRDGNSQISGVAPAALNHVPRWQEVWQAIEYGLTATQMIAVPGASPTQYYDDTMGPAVSFADGATQSAAFMMAWPFYQDTPNGITNGLKLKLVLASSVAGTNSFRVAITVKNTFLGTSYTDTVTIAANGTSLVFFTESSAIMPSGSANFGDPLFIKITRLGTDAADTNTGAMRLYLVSPIRV